MFSLACCPCLCKTRHNSSIDNTNSKMPGSMICTQVCGGMYLVRNNQIYQGTRPNESIDSFFLIWRLPTLCINVIFPCFSCYRICIILKHLIMILSQIQTNMFNLLSKALYKDKNYFLHLHDWMLMPPEKEHTVCHATIHIMSLISNYNDILNGGQPLT